MDRVQDKVNLEAHVWTLTGVFKTCKDRTMKNTNWAQPASAQASDDEIKQFANCVTKSLKAIALFPTTIE
jgi:hypothetical protein